MYECECEWLTRVDPNSHPNAYYALLKFCNVSNVEKTANKETKQIVFTTTTI